MSDKFNNAVGPQIRAPKLGSRRVIPALTILAITGGLQAATQFFAGDMRYQDALGASMHQWYFPWAVLQWAGKWYQLYPDAFLRAGSAGVIVAGVGMISLVVAQMIIANTAKANRFLHGSARWANRVDIENAGLLARRRTWFQALMRRAPAAHGGVYVGAWLDKRGVRQRGYQLVREPYSRES